MADDDADTAPEGWQVPQRRAYLAALLLPLTLVGSVVLAGWAYDDWLRPKHRAPVTTFPAPGVETLIHDGREDPVRQPPRPPADPAIASAKRGVVADGLAGWNATR